MALEGLHNLGRVEGSLTIEGNDALENLEGLRSLQRIERDLMIRTNAALHSLDGLSHLGVLKGRLIITNNPALSSRAARALAENIPIHESGTVRIENNQP